MTLENPFPDTANTWWEIQITCINTDEAAAICYALGAALSETLAENKIRVFIQSAPNDFIESLPSNLRAIKTIEVEKRNWHENCPDLWASKQIGSLKIIPVSGVEDARSSGCDEVLIIPGTGFGTGHHPATAMLVERIQLIDPAPNHVLDLGCGSGILALVARRVWPQAKITGVDNDPLALENARDNLTINAVTDIELLCGTLDDDQTKHYDLIIANLYSSLLIGLKSELKKRCDKLILSGVMESEADALLEAFNDWEFISSRVFDGWFSAELKS